MLESILFYSLAGAAVLSALGMILQKNAVYSVLLLIVALFSLAGIYVLLNAPFVAAVHMIVYAGAIMVLFLFVIMLLDINQTKDNVNFRQFTKGLGALAVVVFVVEASLLLYWTFGDSESPLGLGGENMVVGDTRAIGELLFSKYLLPFEVASVLLLAAIVGAVILAKRDVASSDASK